MINTLRSVAHLQREIGDDLFEALVSSDHTEAVRRFAKKLAKILPTKITVGGRTYEILPILREGEESVKGDIVVARAREMNAHLGIDDGEHLLAHRDELPAVLRGQGIVFVFTDWCHPEDPKSVARVYHIGGDWTLGWDGLHYDFSDDTRVLRRK